MPGPYIMLCSVYSEVLVAWQVQKYTHEGFRRSLYGSLSVRKKRLLLCVCVSIRVCVSELVQYGVSLQQRKRIKGYPKLEQYWISLLTQRKRNQFAYATQTHKRSPSLRLLHSDTTYSLPSSCECEWQVWQNRYTTRIWMTLAADMAFSHQQSTNQTPPPGDWGIRTPCVWTLVKSNRWI